MKVLWNLNLEQRSHPMDDLHLKIFFSHRWLHVCSDLEVRSFYHCELAKQVHVSQMLIDRMLLMNVAGRIQNLYLCWLLGIHVHQLLRVLILCFCGPCDTAADFVDFDSRINPYCCLYLFRLVRALLTHIGILLYFYRSFLLLLITLQIFCELPVLKLSRQILKNLSAIFVTFELLLYVFWHILLIVQPKFLEQLSVFDISCLLIYSLALILIEHRALS